MREEMVTHQGQYPLPPMQVLQSSDLQQSQIHCMILPNHRAEQRVRPLLVISSADHGLWEPAQVAGTGPGHIFVTRDLCHTRHSHKRQMCQPPATATMLLCPPLLCSL